MKYLILCGLMSLLFVACQEEAKSPPVSTSTTTAAPAALQTEGYQLSPIPGSEMQWAEKRDTEGQILESGTVGNGAKQGSWSYFAAGRYPPVKVESYLDGKLHGTVTEYDPVGRLVKILHYKSGDLHGPYAEFRAGLPQVTATYQNGQLHGTYRLHTLQNGKVNRTIEYVAGKEDGPMRWYNDAGDLIQERQYRNGELVE